MIKWMKGLYRHNMSISREKNHGYLRIIFEFTLRGQVAVTILDYLKGIISDFDEVETLTGTAVSLAA